MGEGAASARAAAMTLDDYDFSKEAAVEAQCIEAFSAVRHFEKTHCLALQVRYSTLSYMMSLKTDVLKS